MSTPRTAACNIKGNNVMQIALRSLLIAFVLGTTVRLLKELSPCSVASNQCIKIAKRLRSLDLQSSKSGVLIGLLLTFDGNIFLFQIRGDVRKFTFMQHFILLATEVTESTWQRLVLESDSPVLVDFWAPWCGPCRMIAPLIDELARQYAGKMKCFKVNTDEAPQIASRYGIRSIPTVMFFLNGEKIDTVIGAVPKTTLTTAIEKRMVL
eukprot:Gb_12760 [translate_table: standard]